MTGISAFNRAAAATLRWLHGSVYMPLILRVRWRLFGLANAAQSVRRLPMHEVPGALRLLGATVGDRCYLKPGLQIQNARGDLRGLRIGDNLHLGCDVLIDLSAPVSIGSDVAIGARVNIITALDRGQASDAEPARPVVIEDGALIATAATIMPGVTVGAAAVVSALSVVDRSVPPRTLVAAVTTRHLRGVKPAEVVHATPAGVVLTGD